MKEARNNRLNNFALLHLIAAFCVLIGHSFILCGVNATPTFLNSDLDDIGCEILFVISGFLSTSSLLAKKSSPVKSVIRRFFRIFIPLLVSCVIVVISFSFVTKVSQPIYWASGWKYIWQNSLFYTNYHLEGVLESVPFPNVVNASLWTLGCQLVCSIILIVVAPLIRLIKNDKAKILIPVILFICFAVPALVIEYNDIYHFVEYKSVLVQMLRLVAFFIAGVVCSLLFNSTKHNNKFSLTWAAILLLPMIIISYYTPVFRYIYLPYLCVCIGNAKPLWSNFFNKYDCAYGIYLFAFPVTQMMNEINVINGNCMSYYLIVFVVIVITLLLGLFIKFCVENPSGRLINKIFISIDNKKTGEKKV